jgi:hypothetical protein
VNIYRSIKQWSDGFIKSSRTYVKEKCRETYIDAKNRDKNKGEKEGEKRRTMKISNTKRAKTIKIETQ